jgi:hypothetical protein
MGPVWTCAKNLAPTGTRSPYRPARSQSLQRLSYPAHILLWHEHNILLGMDWGGGGVDPITVRHTKVLQKKRRLLYLNTQGVPRSKHYQLGYKTNHFMM